MFAKYNVRQYNDVFAIDNWRSEFAGPMFNELDTVGLYQGKGAGTPKLGVGVDLIGDAKGIDLSRWQQQELAVEGTINTFSRTTRYSDGSTLPSQCISYDLKINNVGSPTTGENVRINYNFGQMKLGMPSPIELVMPWKF
ncbi:hypothetical protein [Psychromonas sp. MME2]|uniref:hypothetical protein n=1 Tax=unclassified Psychromonas TaxID=2614957 RepID=UPI00339C019E